MTYLCNLQVIFNNLQTFFNAPKENFVSRHLTIIRELEYVAGKLYVVMFKVISA